MVDKCKEQNEEKKKKKHEEKNQRDYLNPFKMIPSLNEIAAILELEHGPRACKCVCLYVCVAEMRDSTTETKMQIKSIYRITS